MWVGVLLSLIVALGIGFINGYLVVKTKIPSFLITLSTFFMLRGINLGVTKATTGTVASDNVSGLDGFASAKAVFASDIPLGFITVKVTVLWWLLFVAIGTWILLRTKVGNWIFAAGGNADSARAVGVPVPKVKIGLFMGVAFLAWFYGMHLLFNFSSVQSGLGIGNEFIYIIAAVVGGCLLTGGYGSRRRRCGRRVHLRHDHPGHRVRRVRPELVLHLPRRDAAARGAGQPLHQELRLHPALTADKSIGDTP